MRKTILLIMVFCLFSCGRPVNVKPLNGHSLDKPVYVVVDYVQIRDDIGKMLNYDKHLNQKRITSLKTQISNLLKAKGFSNHQFVYLSSGLDFNPENEYQLVNNKVKQDELITPPFITSEVIDDKPFNKELVFGFKLAQEAFDFKTYPNINQFKTLPVIDSVHSASGPKNVFERDSLILYARTIVPEVSFGKSMAVGALTGALTLAATGGAGAFISTPNGTPVTTLALVDNQRGELIWRESLNINIIGFSKKQLLKILTTFPAL
jgi:hypothetical protein